jgi:ABC-type dipeptide/oligopeptide/nickel transport system permease component
MHATPGSPLEPSGDNANATDPAFQQNLKELYGLDKPLYEQYGLFVWSFNPTLRCPNRLYLVKTVPI